MSTSPAREPRGLSHARTSFVGRSEAVDKVAGLLTQYRLVTVTGPGGVGKTRLAGEVIRQVAGRFADGVWVAELASVAEPALVPAMVATVLGLHVFAMNVLYPKVLGKRLQLNPLVVTIALLIWGFIWGAMGLILAVPIMAAIKIVCDHTPSLRPIGEWLGD